MSNVLSVFVVRRRHMRTQWRRWRSNRCSNSKSTMTSVSRFSSS